MRKQIFGALLGAVALMVTGAADAATIAFNFDNSSSAGDSTFGSAIPNANVTLWAMTSGTPTYIDLLGTGTDLVQGTGWNGGGNDFKFTFTVNAGFSVTLSALSFFDATESNRESPIGPTSWAVTIDGNGFGSGPTHVIPGVNSLSLAPLTFGAGTHAVLLHASGANGVNRTWSVDSFVLTGEATAVPVPAAVWLLGTALVGMMGLGRRKRA